MKEFKSPLYTCMYITMATLCTHCIHVSPWQHYVPSVYMYMYHHGNTMYPLYIRVSPWQHYVPTVYTCITMATLCTYCIHALSPWQHHIPTVGLAREAPTCPSDWLGLPPPPLHEHLPLIQGLQGDTHTTSHTHTHHITHTH